MFKWLGLVLVAAALIGGIVIYPNLKSQPKPTVVISSPEPVDYTARFAIYTHGTLRIFTAGMYHNLSKDVFITADNPNLVRVKKAGVTWQEFFDTLPFELNQSCLVTGTKQTFCDGQDGKLSFTLNGQENAEVLAKVIQPDDELVISFGR